MVKERAIAKFDETVEIAMNLGVDPRHADQMVRGVGLAAQRHRPHASAWRCSPAATRPRRPRLPAPTSSVPKTSSTTVQGGTDRFRPLHRHARHDAAGRPSRQGARPPRPDAEPEGRHRHQRRRRRRCKDAKGGAVEFRVEKAGIIQAGVGKASFDEPALVANIRAFADAVQKARPAGAKGTFVQRVAMSSTMGPGVKVDPATLSDGASAPS